MTGAIEKELQAYIETLNKAQKKTVLGIIKTLFPGKEAGEGITIEQYNKELDEARAEIARGEYYTHEEAIQIFNKHLSDRK